MVVKTDLCAWSELRVYPGHGTRFVTRSGQLVVLLSSKVDSLYHQRKKNAKLMWTQTWRRMHKKINVETSAKRRVRKIIKVNRAPTGISKEEFEGRIKAASAIKAPVAAVGTKNPVLEQASVAEAKAKKKAMIAAKKKAAGAAPKQSAAAKHAGKGR